MMDRNTLDAVARNAHLKLSEKESEEYLAEFTGVLDYFSVLDDVPVRNITKLDPMGTAGTVRKDVPEPNKGSDTVLKGTDTYDGYVRGPRL
jgi:aspartyl/glutamyl-tRNA(Asn/Gln) amidotransferase C subunit